MAKLGKPSVRVSEGIIDLRFPAVPWLIVSARCDQEAVSDNGYRWNNIAVANFPIIEITLFNHTQR